jgi:superfamily I DNA/RNA helicase
MCYQLVGDGIPVAIQGRDIGDGLIRLAESFDVSAVVDLMDKVERYRARETDRLVALQNSEGAIEALNDQCACLIAASRDCILVSEVITKIRTLFLDVSSADQSRYVLLSSIHRAKGREADHVAILGPDLMPHSMAKTPAALEQEFNLAYVAATRSKHRLSFCGSIPSILKGN